MDIYNGILHSEKTRGYKENLNNIKLGSYINGYGYWQKGKKDQDEFLFINLKNISTNLLSVNETGLTKDAKFNIEQLKKKYHVYLCSDNICSMHLVSKSIMFASIREILCNKGYLEINTPILSKNFYGGGSTPFITRRIDGNDDMYLRITSEVALKIIIGGGFTKVFEIGHSFRNAPINSKHATPFMGAEVYTAFIDEEKNIELALDIIKKIECEITNIFNKFSFSKKITFMNDIRRVKFEEYFKEKKGYTFKWEDYMKNEEEYQSNSSDIYKVLKNELIANQIEPILITDLPGGNSPLIKSKTSKTLYRNYLVANGATIMEIAIGEDDYVQLIKKMSYQHKYNEKHVRDYSSFLHCFKMGMPPVGSIFIGVDRIVPMFLGLNNINDFIMNM